MQREITTEEERRLWAFAIDTSNRQRKTRRRQPAPQRQLSRYAITSCSPRAKALGVRIGMRYNEARKLAPSLRVIVTNR